MKQLKKAVWILLAFVLMLSGCANPGELMHTEGDEFDRELSLYEDEHQGEIPKSVLDTLDFMLENYTDGVAEPDVSTLPTPVIPPQDAQDLIDNAPEKATDYDGVKAIILKALANTEPAVAVKMDMNVYGGNMGDFLYELFYMDIGGNYIVEALGGTNYWSYSVQEDPATNECTLLMQFHYFDTGYHNHNFTLDQVKQMKVELQNKAEQIVKDLNLNALSDYEKVFAVNEYLRKTVTYSSGNSPYQAMQHTPYGALINGDCVCEGYAKAVQLLLKMCGMETHYVCGDAGGPHAWNLVKVDGQYYQLDVTWNDVDLSSNLYFLVTDDYMSLSRTWDKIKYPASAPAPYQKP